MGRVVAGRASGVKLFFPKTDKCVIIINPYRIGRGPGYQRPPQVSQSRAPGRNYVTAKHSENKRRKRGGKRVKKQREVWKGRVDILNIGAMTERGRELADMTEQRNMNIVSTGNKVER